MVGIVILNYNNCRLTIDCFESIEKWNSMDCKYVLVDNASTDNSLAHLDNYFSEKYTNQYQRYQESSVKPETLSRISLISSTHNYGYARGNNLGCYLLEKDQEINYILILNNDTLFIQDILPSMVKFLEMQKDAGLISPLLQENHDGKIKYNSARENRKVGELFAMYAHCGKIVEKYNKKHQVLLNNPALLDKDYTEIEVPTGACFMVRKDLFKEIGYFDPNTFLYFEENILYKKTRMRNVRNYVLPKQKIIHLGQATTRKTNFNYFQECQKAKSCYYYGIHYSGMSPLLKPLFVILYYWHLSLVSMKYFIKKVLKAR